jgi:predicted secreted protein
MTGITPKKALALGILTLTVLLMSLLTVQAASCDLVVTDQENGRSFGMNVGQKITVNLRDPGGGGYKFLTPEYDPAVLKMTGERHLARAEPPRMGDFGRKVYEFQAVNGGQTTLVVPIKRPWEKQSETYLKVTITVRP